MIINTCGLNPPTITEMPDGEITFDDYSLQNWWCMCLLFNNLTINQNHMNLTLRDRLTCLLEAIGIAAFALVLAGMILIFIL